MRNVLGNGTVLGYCTNVHAGANYQQMLENLEQHAVSVREQVSPDETMGVGLWLSAQSAREVIEQDQIAAFAEWLHERELFAYTINGFPFGDFHQPVVKHKVYHPTWADSNRLDYTVDLAKILCGLLDDVDQEGSISTLPIGWRSDVGTSNLKSALNNLAALAKRLNELERETGKLIHIDIEPEPGCFLDRCNDVIRFFTNLAAFGNEEVIRRHVRVCHDICHTAVMSEDQCDTLQRYRDQGIQVGKVQVSSAVRVRFNTLTRDERDEALLQLRSFQEDRYLHQTVVDMGERTYFYEDLPIAVEKHIADHGQVGEWRVHFHVPLFLERFGLIESTMDHAEALLANVTSLSDVKHFEVETYAWDVLPDELREDNLAVGIAKELAWVRDRVRAESR